MSKRNSKRTKSAYLRVKAMHKAAAEKLARLSHNEVAAKLRVSGDKFLDSPEWQALRRKVIQTQGRRCACCGRVPKNPRHINVDHVKPRKFYPELALDESNLQVLCGDCNRRKGNADTDYRQTSAWNGPVNHGEFSDDNIGKMLDALR